MKLNLSIIRQHLSGHYACKQFGIEDTTLSLSRPVYYDAGQVMEPNVLYVTRANALPPALPEGACLICSGSRLPLEWMTSGNQILLASGGDVFRLLNDIHSIFNKFDAWDFALSQAVGCDTDFDLKELMRLGISILENPLSVVDPSLQVIFSSSVASQADGLLEIRIDDTPYPLSSDTRVSIKESCRTERLLTAPFASVSEAQYKTYCQNLFLLDHFMGSCWFSSENRPFQENDFLLADHFFSYFTRGFQKYLRNFRKSESPAIAALHSLLKGVPLTPEEIDLFALQDDEYWLCFKLKEKRNRKSLPKDYMFATLNVMMPKNVYATTHQKEIVGLLRLTSAKEETLDLFQEMLIRMDYLCGFSHPFRSIQAFSTGLLQASFVAERCLHTDGNKSVHFFQDNLLAYMLHECCGKLPPESLCSDGLKKLIEYDKKRDTEYVKTLEIYLKNEMSIPKTSEQLYIHRTSLLKRLEKIQRITKADLEDTNTRLYYRLYFALWDHGYVAAPDIAFE